MNDGMRIQFPEDQGFAPGESTISAGLEKALAELAGAVQYYPVMLVVEGHTDDAFLSTPTYPDAQSLSIARARAAADALVEAGGFDPSLLMIEGLGSAVPKDPTKTGPKARRADRRVEVRRGLDEQGPHCRPGRGGREMMVKDAGKPIVITVKVKEKGPPPTWSPSAT